MSRLSRQQIVNRIAEAAGVSESTVNAVFTEFSKLAHEGVSDGILIPDLGVLALAEGPKREVRNPATGETLTIPGPPTIKFLPDSATENVMVNQKPTQKDDVAEDARVLPVIRLIYNVDDLTLNELPEEASIENESHLGGEPDWIQYDERPICCGTKMTFYCQLDTDLGNYFPVGDSAMIYVFLCEHCGNTASVFQSY